MGIFRDKIVVTHSHNTTNSTVIEKRAPTDDSVMLLKEMEEKSESKFEARIDISNNILDITVLEFCKDMTFDGYKFRYYCKINEEVIKGDINLDRHNKDRPELILGMIKEDLSKRIAHSIIMDNFENLIEEIRPRKY